VPLLHQTYRASGKNAQHVHFLNFLLCFGLFYLLFYSSYILLRWLQMIWQMTSSTTFSKAPKEARPVVILGTTIEEAWLTVILGTTKWQCLHMFTLDLYVHIDLWSCLWILCCVCMRWILWSLNEWVGYCDLWMNALDLDVYMDILYIMCAICKFCNFSCAGYTAFMQKKLQHRLTYDSPSQPS
jgi:hypothetical protein